MPPLAVAPQQAEPGPFLSLVPPRSKVAEPPEAPGGNCTPEDPCVTWRHAHWSTLRSATAAGLTRIGAPPARLVRLAACGRNAWVYVDAQNPRRYKLTADYCHDRFCVPCARRKARETARMLREHVPDQPTLFVTLTLKPDGRTLQALVDLLLKSFAALRRTQVWKTTVRGGACFVELKRSKGVDGWNVHAHVLCESNWIPHQALKDTWAHITGGSFIVDVRRVRTLSDLARYVTKYVSKGIPDALARNPEHLDDALTALRGRRLCSTFGTWRGIPLTPGKTKGATTTPPDPHPAGAYREVPDLCAASHSEANTPRAASHREAEQQPTTWIPIGSLDQLLTRASLGDLQAAKIVRALEQQIRPKQVSLTQLHRNSNGIAKLNLGLVEMALAELGLRRRSTVASLPH